MVNKFPSTVRIAIKNEAELAMLYSLLNISDCETVIKGAQSSCSNYINRHVPIFKDNSIAVNDFLTYVFATVKDKIKQINNYSEKVSNISNIFTKIIEKKGKEYVEILGFENIKTISELPKSYVLGYPRYYKFYDNHDSCNNNFTGVPKLVVQINGIHKVIFEIGDVIEKTQFEKYIEIMKQAGERLVNNNKAIKEDKRIQQLRKDLKERAEEQYNSDKDKTHVTNNHIYTI